MTWDVTGLVQGWRTGTYSNYGMLLKHTSESLGESGPKSPSSRYAAEPALQPQLRVTYSGGVTLHEPDTLHADGAELSWDRFSGGTPFDRYEIHRSSEAAFVPSMDTLIATLTDEATTTYRDTTAAPERAFTYKVVTSDGVSNGRTVTLPADGQAAKVLSLSKEDKATYIRGRVDGSPDCYNFGSNVEVRLGRTVDHVYRSLIQFDLSDVPTDAQIATASLSLWHEARIDDSIPIDAHRLTSGWDEGGVKWYCTGDAATWQDRRPGVPWTTPGGDFDPTVLASVPVTAPQYQSRHEFDLTGLVSQWVAGQAPNHGVLLKLADEANATDRWGYMSDDEPMVPEIRPRLRVSYADGSHAQGPTVSLSSPGPGRTLTNEVTLAVLNRAGFPGGSTP